jgi:hypothetical protein
LDVFASHSFQKYELPTGDVEIQIYSLGANLNFSPDMRLTTRLQYDNISEAVGLSARYYWEFSPGSDLFVSLNQDGELLDASRYRPNTTQSSIRIGHTMRF